jgi:hypothetical protein
VVIVQALGTKDYYMCDNTVARRTHLGETLDFSCIRDETSTFFGEEAAGYARVKDLLDDPSPPRSLFWSLDPRCVRLALKPRPALGTCGV